MTTARVKNVLKRVKDSPSGSLCYRRPGNLWLDSFSNPSTPFPTEWVAWRNLLVKFGLFATRPASVWTFLVRELADRSTKRVFELAVIRSGQLASLGAPSESPQPLIELW